MRSSFCLYNDGKFYQTQASGCIGQVFSWGYWKNEKDTIVLTYDTNNIYNYSVTKSNDTQSSFQIVKVIDCYNQPVRFETILHDSFVDNIYNIGFIKIKKNEVINYAPYFFNKNIFEYDNIISNADTITFKWNCNRESLESIDGGSLYVNSEARREKIILKNKEIETVAYEIY